MPHRHPALALALLAVSLHVAACGDDAAEDDTGAGAAGGGGGDASSATGPGPVGTTTGGAEPALGVTSAPTRTSVEATWVGDENPPTDLAAYRIESDLSEIEILGMDVDGATKTIRMTTTPQGLGVAYTLRVDAPGSSFDGAASAFHGADTVELWATEFVAFRDYLVSARRVAVGEHAVLYLEQGLEALDTELTRDNFDARIHPIETELFREPPDRDGNGKIVLLGLDGRDWYGGYFNPVNTMTDADAQAEWGSRSNEMEIIYFNVAIMRGFDAFNVVPHEYLHLLYAEERGAFDGWNWHNEGLAECAVNAVWGENDQSAAYYVSDPAGDLAGGKSLVRWEYGNYSQYAQAYVFLTYAASRLGGVEGFGELFRHPGDPRELEGLFQERLGESFAQVHLGALTAAWAQAPEGPRGFSGLLTLPGRPQLSPSPELSLRPYAGAFFQAPEGAVSPDGAGPDVVHVGVDEAGEVDEAPPFSAGGGVVIALNGLQDPFESDTQESGELAAPPPRSAHPGAALGRALAWRHAPPVPPRHRALRAFREATRP